MLSLLHREGTLRALIKAKKKEMYEVRHGGAGWSTPCMTSVHHHTSPHITTHHHAQVGPGKQIRAMMRRVDANVDVVNVQP